MLVDDVNEFVDGYEHEARLKGTISFAAFEDGGPATLTLTEPDSRFHYLRVNPATGEAEMQYDLRFASNDGRRFRFTGIKYMQKDDHGVREVLEDYTTLYCHVCEVMPDGSERATGTAYLKFRTFEDLAAVGNLAGFLASFQITGTNDPVMQLRARMRFLAFTGQFVAREYDPLMTMQMGG
jgi:hypothetical protein